MSIPNIAANLSASPGNVTGADVTFTWTVLGGEAIRAGMKIDLEIDARGLLCPLPVLRLQKRMKPLEAGAMIRLLADDPAAHVDVPHFCAEQGHGFLGSDEAEDATAYLVQKG